MLMKNISIALPEPQAVELMLDCQSGTNCWCGDAYKPHFRIPCLSAPPFVPPPAVVSVAHSQMTSPSRSKHAFTTTQATSIRYNYRWMPYAHHVLTTPPHDTAMRACKAFFDPPSGNLGNLRALARHYRLSLPSDLPL